MAFTDLLIDTCIVRRFVAGDPDDYGKPAEAWSDHITDLPCRLVANTNREVVVGAEVVVAKDTLFVDDVDVTEQDRIIVDEITYEILSVVIRKDSSEAHHKELLMRTVR